MLRSLGEEALVAQLLRSAVELLVRLGEILLQTLALRGDIHGAGGVQLHGQGRGRQAQLDARGRGEPVLGLGDLDDRADGVLLFDKVDGGGVEAGRDLLGGLDTLVGAETTQLGDELVDVGDAAGGVLVGGHSPVGVLGGRPGRDDEARRVALGTVGEDGPQGLGDEGHRRVQQTQDRVEHATEHQTGVLTTGLLGVGGGVPVTRDLDLGDLQVPVAEFVPGEAVEGLVGDGELVAVEVGVHQDAQFLELVEDPAVGVGEVLAGREVLLLVLTEDLGTVHQRELGGVEELGGEVTGGLRGILTDRQVGAGVGAAGQGEAQGVRPVVADPVHRVDAVAQGLGHLAAVLVADEAVEEDVGEGHLRATVALFGTRAGLAGTEGGALDGVGEGAEHHHAGDPEEEDVVAGDQHGGRVELLQLVRLLRPAHRGEGPQCRGEPGVQDVVLLVPALAGGLLVVGTAADDLAVGSVPDRDAVAPPQLTGDAPVVHVVDPVEPARLLGGGVDDGVALTDGVPGHLGELVDLDPPLLGQARLDGLLGALGVAHGVDVGVDALEDATLLLQRQPDLLTGLEAVQAVEPGTGVRDVAGLVDDLGHLEVVALTHGEVVRVVGRGDLHHACAELGVDVVVGDDDHAASLDERVREGGADEVLVALVVRVDGDGDIAEHGLDTGGRDIGVRALALDIAVAQGDQLTLVVGVDDLDVGDGGAQHRGPVDQALRAVDQAAVEELLEDGLDSLGQAVVEGEALALPVDRVADGAHLVLDDAAELVLPLPDALDELLAAVVETVLALGLLEHGLDLGLGRDAGVVGARQPQDLVALHALTAGHGVHEGVVECVTHVQLAGDVRRREHDGERLPVARRVRVEVTGVHPALVEGGFYVGGVPLLREAVGPVGRGLVAA